MHKLSLIFSTQINHWHLKCYKSIKYIGGLISQGEYTDV